MSTTTYNEYIYAKEMLKKTYKRINNYSGNNIKTIKQYIANANHWLDIVVPYENDNSSFMVFVDTKICDRYPR